MQADNPLYGEYTIKELRVNLFQPPLDDEIEELRRYNYLYSPLSYDFTLFFSLPRFSSGDIDEGRLLHAAIHEEEIKIMMTQLNL